MNRYEVHIRVGNYSMGASTAKIMVDADSMWYDEKTKVLKFLVGQYPVAYFHDGEWICAVKVNPNE